MSTGRRWSLLNSRATPDTWRHRLNLDCAIHSLPELGDPTDARSSGSIGAACVGAAARLLGVVSWDSLAAAMTQELTFLGTATLSENRDAARASFDRMVDFAGSVVPRVEKATADARSHDWVEVPFESARVAAPTIHNAGTSVRGEDGAVAHDASGRRRGSVQSLLVDLQHVLPRWRDRGRRRRRSAHRLRSLQGLSGVCRGLSASRHLLPFPSIRSHEPAEGGLE